MMTLAAALMLVIQLAACTPQVRPSEARPDTAAHPPATSPATLPVTAPASQPATQPEIAPADNVDPLDPGVNELLGVLEASAADLVCFTAKIKYEKFDQTLQRRELRTGEIIYQLNPQTRQKRFAALFDTLIAGNRKTARLKHYIFDGRWLVEIDHEDKQFIKREIVAPGKTLDPLKLGEGPFPLPIGQPRKEVLARFDVTLAEVPTEGMLKDLKDVDGLLLVPKPGTAEAKDFTKIKIYYDRATHLPIGIMALEANENRKTILLTDAQRNPALDADTLKKMDIMEPDPREWRVDVQPWVAK